MNAKHHRSPLRAVSDEYSNAARSPLFTAVTLFLGLFLQISVAHSQNLTGSWMGTLSTPGGDLPLEFDLGAGGRGTVKSPAQNFTSALQYSSAGNQITIQVPSVNGTFKGTVAGNEARGTWTQNGGTLALSLSKSGDAEPKLETMRVWTGTLSAPGGRLPLEFDLSAGGGGTVKSPAQSFTSALQYSQAGNQLTIQVPSVNGTFKGTVTGNEARGTWTQNGIRLPLALSRH